MRQPPISSALCWLPAAGQEVLPSHTAWVAEPAGQSGCGRGHAPACQLAHDRDGEWGRIGCVGFGAPTHIALLRKLCVAERGWLSSSEFEDGIAAVNLLPGPASTQLAIFCAWRLRATSAPWSAGPASFVRALSLSLRWRPFSWPAIRPRLALGRCGRRRLGGCRCGR